MLQFLVAAALSCSFALLAPLYGRRFVEFFLPEVADYAVAGTLSLKSSERAFNRLVFADFNGRHAFFNPPSPCAVIFQMLNYYTKPRPQSQLFPTRFAIIFSPFPSPVISSGGQSPQSRNLPTAIKFARVLNFIYAGFSRNDIWAGTTCPPCVKGGSKGGLFIKNKPFSHTSLKLRVTAPLLKKWSLQYGIIFTITCLILLSTG